MAAATSLTLCSSLCDCPPAARFMKLFMGIVVSSYKTALALTQQQGALTMMDVEALRAGEEVKAQRARVKELGLSLDCLACVATFKVPMRQQNRTLQNCWSTAPVPIPTVASSPPAISAASVPAATAAPAAAAATVANGVNQNQEQEQEQQEEHHLLVLIEQQRLELQHLRGVVQQQQAVAEAAAATAEELRAVIQRQEVELQSNSECVDTGSVVL